MYITDSWQEVERKALWDYKIWEQGDDNGPKHEWDIFGRQKDR